MTWLAVPITPTIPVLVMVILPVALVPVGAIVMPEPAVALRTTEVEV